MSGRTRIYTGLGSAVALTIAIFLGLAYRAIHQVQPFYAAALEVDANKLAEESHTMERRVAVLVSDAKQQPVWQAAFSDDEVNGWLAVALKDKFADLLPTSVIDPRVAFEDKEAVVGFRFQSEEFSSVISVRVSAWVSEPDVVAVRLVNAHLGTLPIPLAKVADHISKTADKIQVPLRWTQQDGAPVALFSLPGVSSTESEKRQLDAVELHQGELYLAGSTIKLGPLSSEKLLAEKAEGSIAR